MPPGEGVAYHETMMRQAPRHCGFIEVICGPMFSGKSEELIRRLRRAGFARQRVVVCKPATDDRYHDTDVVSHDGLSVSAVRLSQASEILAAVSDAQVIAIDEAQFFDAELTQVIEILADRGLRVIVAGLDKDFAGRPFGPMGSILARADFVDKLQAICQQCAEPATCTQRLIDGHPAPADAPIVLVGAADSYEPRCRSCHSLG
jgi:thymidine kinase